MFKLFTQQMEKPATTFMSRDFAETMKAVSVLYKYYGNSAYYVNNQHILVRLINFLMSATPDNDDMFLRAIKSNAQQVGPLGIGTQYRAGELMLDPFVGGMNHCLIYLDEHSSRIAPVTVTYHPFTLVNLPILDGEMVEKDLGADKLTSQVCTYTVSLRALMFGYRQYLRTTDPTTRRVGPAHYIYTRVLPPMMLSFYHLALWNRLWYPLAKKPIVDAPNRHRVKVLNLYHSDIARHNNVHDLRSVSQVTYQDLLGWQMRRGYGLHYFTHLPAGVNIYRPTAAFAWFSRVNIIRSLLLLGDKGMYRREGTLIRELMFQYNLTQSGKFILDKSQLREINPLFNQLLEAIDLVS